MHLDRRALDHFADRLGVFFYLLMPVAFIAALAGSPGSGMFFLLVGAAAHVTRTAIEELVVKRGDRARLDLELPDSLSQIKLPPPTKRTPSTRTRR
jgi:hypothetical protein